MSKASIAQEKPAIKVRNVESAEGVSAILQPHCPAVRWQRDLPARFHDWMEGLAPDQLPDARVIVKSDEVHDVVEHVLSEAGLEACAERDFLINDISKLAAVLGDVTGAEKLQLRLDVVDTNACRKFHMDYVSARLICAYRGTGTQYGYSYGLSEPEEIEEVPTGSPIILRGVRWWEDESQRVVHRSPPIEGTGETRFLLVLNPVDEDAMTA